MLKRESREKFQKLRFDYSEDGPMGKKGGLFTQGAVERGGRG